MNWIELNHPDQIKSIQSQSTPSVIFKHSTRCIISKMALKSFENDWKNDTPVNTYFLDLLNHRELSSTIAETFQVYHESPQMLLIVNGECVLDASHQDISVDEILEELQNQ